jgi:hypothetical protein
MRRGIVLAEAAREWKHDGESKRFMSFWMAAAIFIGSSPQRPMRIAKHQKRGMFLSILKAEKKPRWLFPTSGWMILGDIT